MDYVIEDAFADEAAKIMFGHSGEWKLLVMDYTRGKKIIAMIVPEDVVDKEIIIAFANYILLSNENLKGFHPLKDIKWFLLKRALHDEYRMSPLHLKQLRQVYFKGGAFKASENPIVKYPNKRVVLSFDENANTSPEDEFLWDTVYLEIEYAHGLNYPGILNSPLWKDRIAVIHEKAAQERENLNSKPHVSDETIAESRKRARQQKFDQLPDVLEGLDAFEALWRAAGNQGFFEQSFKGTPMVVDKLRDEAMRTEKGEPDEEKTLRSRNPSSGQSSAMAMDTIIKGRLVFANEAVFNAMQQRRYSGRAMLKQLGKRPPYLLPDVHVLAPHEFGQVPGFVAGQHRSPRDRLCAVMITFDPALWDMSLRDRKILINASKGPKLWAFPAGWLFELPEGRKWWDAGWFGTPFDPSLPDFTEPETTALAAE